MAVRKFSARHFGFALGRAATQAWPGLRARMPFYDRVAPMVEVGRCETYRETQTIELDDAEAAFAQALPAQPPKEFTRDVALVALDNVTVLGLTGAVVDEKRELLLLPRGLRDFATYHHFRLVPSAPVAKPAANYINMMGAARGHRHFFHFLFDRLPRLYYLLNYFALGREPIVVLTNDDLARFQRDIFGFLAARHSNLKFISIPQGERWRLPRLYQVDDFQPVKRTAASTRALDFMRELVFDGYGLAPSGNKRRLYVTRSDTKKRRIANEAELLPLLAERGFEVVAPGKLSFRDQAALFMGAEAIVGPHGAGLTNILFAPKSARVLEIFPANKVKNTYLLLAHSLGQTYRGMVAGVGGSREWFRVDPRALETALDQLLA